MEKGKEKPKTFTDLEACQKELAKAFKELSKVNRKLEKTKNYNKQLIEEVIASIIVLFSFVFKISLLCIMPMCC